MQSIRRFYNNASLSFPLPFPLFSTVHVFSLPQCLFSSLQFPFPSPLIHTSFPIPFPLPLLFSFPPPSSYLSRFPPSSFHSFLPLSGGKGKQHGRWKGKHSRKKVGKEEVTEDRRRNWKASGYFLFPLITFPVTHGMGSVQRRVSEVSRKEGRKERKEEGRGAGLEER